jgi:hypothetical protein
VEPYLLLLLFGSLIALALGVASLATRRPASGTIRGWLSLMVMAFPRRWRMLLDTGAPPLSTEA